MNTSAAPHGTEIPAATPRPGNCAEGSSSRPSAPLPSVAHRGRLRALTPAKLRALWATTIPADKIGAAYGVSGAAVRDKAKRLGLPKRRHPHEKMDAETFTRLWNAGVRSQDIADVAGTRWPQNVRLRARKLGLAPRKRSLGAGKNNGQGICGWGGTITIHQYHEQELGRLMTAAG